MLPARTSGRAGPRNLYYSLHVIVYSILSFPLPATSNLVLFISIFFRATFLSIIQLFSSALVTSILLLFFTSIPWAFSYDIASAPPAENLPLSLSLFSSLHWINFITPWQNLGHSISTKRFISFFTFRNPDERFVRHSAILNLWFSSTTDNIYSSHINVNADRRATCRNRTKIQSSKFWRDASNFLFLYRINSTSKTFYIKHRLYVCKCLLKNSVALLRTSLLKTFNNENTLELSNRLRNKSGINRETQSIELNQILVGWANLFVGSKWDPWSPNNCVHSNKGLIGQLTQIAGWNNYRSLRQNYCRIIKFHVVRPALEANLVSQCEEKYFCLIIRKAGCRYWTTIDEYNRAERIFDINSLHARNVILVCRFNYFCNQWIW